MCSFEANVMEDYTNNKPKNTLYSMAVPLLLVFVYVLIRLVLKPEETHLSPGFLVSQTITIYYVG